jgi:O-antigen ligase
MLFPVQGGHTMTAPMGTLRSPGTAAAVFLTPERHSPVPHYLMLVFLFVYCSRIQELIPQLRVTGPLQLILLAIMAITLQFGAILRIPGGKLLIALNAWSILCIPFSVWPGGTIMHVQTALRSLITVAIVVAFIRTVPEAIRAMHTIGLAMALAASMSFVFGVAATNAGRLELAGSGTLGDPNYYCYYVLSGLPFLFLGASLTTGVRRLLFVLLMLPVFVVIGKTGSRMGLIAFAAAVTFAFFVASARQKLLLIVGTTVLVVIAAATLPADIVQRFTTILTAEEDTAAAQMALGSTESRKYLFIRSLQITIQYPLFGVGPGMFAIAEGEDAATLGIKGAWHATHNTYTQYSSEIGILGSLFFISALARSYAGLNRIRKSGPDPATRRAGMLTQMSFVTVCVSMAFLSIGYGGIPYMLIAVSGALQVALAKQAMSSNPQMSAVHFPNS